MRLNFVALIFLISATFCAEMLHFKNVAFRKAPGQQKSERKERIARLVSFALSRKRQKANRRNFSSEYAAQQNKLVGSAGLTFLNTKSTAQAIVGSKTDYLCNYSLSSEFLDQIIIVLSNIQSNYEKLQNAEKRQNPNPVGDAGDEATGFTKPAWASSSRRLSLLRSFRKRPTFARYKSIVLPNYERSLVAKKYARCVPKVSGNGRTKNLSSTVHANSVTQADLIDFKTDFEEINQQYVQLFAPLNLNSRDSDSAEITQGQMEAIVMMANKAIQSEQQLENAIADLGLDSTKFHLTNTEVLVLWNMKEQYDNVKAQAKAGDSDFANKEAALSGICSQVLTTFQVMDTDLQGLLNLNNDFVSDCQGLANVNTGDQNQMQTATILIPKAKQTARQIEAILNKVEQSLQMIDTLKKEANDALNDMKRVADSRSAATQSLKGSAVTQSNSAVTLRVVLAIVVSLTSAVVL